MTSSIAFSWVGSWQMLNNVDLIKYVFNLFNLKEDVFIAEDVASEIDKIKDKAGYLRYLRDNINSVQFVTSYQKFILLTDNYKREMTSLNDVENFEIYHFCESLYTKFSQLLDLTFKNQETLDYSIYPRYISVNLTTTEFQIASKMAQKYGWKRLINMSNSQVYRFKTELETFTYAHFEVIKKEEFIIEYKHPQISSKVSMLLGGKL